MIVFSFLVMKSKASSQETSRHSPAPRSPTRSMGFIGRCLSSRWEKAALPLAQRLVPMPPSLLFPSIHTG